ncbi:MAG: adenylyltransferase/cytidyltransferase family protein, partial [Alphaproteobacteria bacterium]|nr:adenylyltransferase/cytidyltransferase family protein [Alphaproteobacteria bacterium]
MYLSYAAGFDAWGNPALIAVTALIGIALPAYSRVSNRIEQRVNYALVLVTAGRLARFAAQFAFNLAVFLIIQLGGVFGDTSLSGLGGIVGAAALTTAASQGAQYVAIMLFNRNVGDLNRNVMLALAANIVVTAAAVVGVPVVQPAFVVLGIGLAVFVFGSGILSDLRGVLFPKRGIGIFFGTFNPFHITHLRLIRDALEHRNLERVIVHPTLVPRGHRLALERGDIVVDRLENGLQIYERTDRADPYVDYFPTGQRFFAPETRRHLIEGALEEAGLSNQVEVAFMPEVYDARGFHGVIAEIKKNNPGKPVHGIHG